MNRRKIENWVIFGLKLLPFLMLAIFAIYCHRHTIDNTTIPDLNSKVVSNLHFLSEETSFYNFVISENNNTIDEEYNTFYALDESNLHLFNATNTPDGNFAVFYNYLSSPIPSGTFNVMLNFNSGDYIDFYIISNENAFIVDDWNTSIEDLVVSNDETVISNYTNFIIGDFSYSSIYLESVSNEFDLNEIYYYNFNGSENYFFVSVDYTYKNFNYINPINASFIYFNEFLDHNINLNIFNINDVYDWTVTYWFDSTAPLFYKPIFLILVYELIIDLLILLYSFITFIMKFAQKWLNGIYNKDW